MDLGLFGRVLWRFKWLVGLGVVAAIVLTLFAAARVDVGSRTVSWRSQEQWASYSRIFVTQQGFPWGKITTGSAQDDPGRFSSLAILYANLADSDAVHQLAFGGAPKNGRVEAAAILASQSGNDALPLLSIAGISHSRAAAISLARRETEGLVRYVRALQQQNGIAADNRVVLQVVLQPTTAKLLSSRSKTLPTVVFLTVLIAFCGLALVLENLRPGVGAAESAARPSTVTPVGTYGQFDPEHPQSAVVGGSPDRA